MRILAGGSAVPQAITVRLPIRATWKRDGAVVEGIWVALGWDSRNWKKRPVYYMPAGDRWWHSAPHCGTLVTIGGDPVNDQERQFLLDHIAAHSASLEQRGGGRGFVRPPAVDLTKSPQRAAPSAASSTDAEPGVAPAPQRAASPDSPQLMRPPKRVKRNLALAPHGRPSAAAIPGPAALPPGAEVRAVADDLKEVVRAALRDATGQLTEAVGPQVRTGLVNVQDTLRQHKVSLQSMQRELTRLTSELAKTNKRCRCEELPDLQQQLADAATQHRETSVDVTSLRAAQGLAAGPHSFQSL